MIKLNETILTEVLRNIVETYEHELLEISIYSSKTYCNCKDNLLIGKFYGLENIGSYLLVQSVGEFKVKQINSLLQIDIGLNTL